tara:strand:+ start:242 stop:646 length:405 start_codon:yes stop_codon:yes gene_type:complete
LFLSSLELSFFNSGLVVERECRVRAVKTTAIQIRVARLKCVDFICNEKSDQTTKAPTTTCKIISPSTEWAAFLKIWKFLLFFIKVIDMYPRYNVEIAAMYLCPIWMLYSMPDGKSSFLQRGHVEHDVLAPIPTM